MHMNRLNRRAGSGSCMTVLLQYSYTRTYRNENVSKRWFTFSPLILNTLKLHNENDAWLLAVTADECTHKNEIHWTMLSFFQSTSASSGEARRKRIISLLRFTPSVSHLQWPVQPTRIQRLLIAQGLTFICFLTANTTSAIGLCTYFHPEMEENLSSLFLFLFSSTKVEEAYIPLKS